MSPSAPGTYRSATHDRFPVHDTHLYGKSHPGQAIFGPTASPLVKQRCLSPRLHEPLPGSRRRSSGPPMPTAFCPRPGGHPNPSRQVDGSALDERQEPCRERLSALLPAHRWLPPRRHKNTVGNLNVSEVHPGGLARSQVREVPARWCSGAVLLAGVHPGGRNRSGNVAPVRVGHEGYTQGTRQMLP